MVSKDQWWIQDFPKVGRNPRVGGGGGREHTILPKFPPKTAWSWKNFDAEDGGGGGRVGRTFPF